ncbi:MAG: PorP/SprF family type IX secretion system membrane protein [Bacteroidales bacterium]
MKKQLLFLIFIVQFFSVQVFAQQGVVFSQYVFNGLMINPAYAGYKELFNASVFYRNQWSGIEHAPTTISLLADAMVYKGVLGVGGHILNDQIGIQKTISMFSDYSYRIKIDRKSRLSMGLSIGLTQMSFDEALIRLNNPDDPILQTNILRKAIWRPDFNVGFFYDHKLFSVGLSLTELWTDYKIIKKKPQLYLLGQTLYTIDKKYVLKFSLMYKDDFDMQPSVDLSVFAILYTRYWVGMLWRNGLPFSGRIAPDLKDYTKKATLNSLSFLFDFFVSDNFHVGYAYDLPLSRVLTKASYGSHEVMLGFTVGRKSQRVLTPRYF